MERVEGDRLDWERRFFWPFFCPVVRLGETEEGGRACGVLVVELDRLDPAAVLCAILPAGFCIHIRLRIHLDSVHPQSDHPRAFFGETKSMSIMRCLGG